jgi:hypothetical protein
MNKCACHFAAEFVGTFVSPAATALALLLDLQGLSGLLLLSPNLDRANSM